MKILHDIYELPFIEIQIKNYYKAKDKDFLKEIVDSVYDAIFSYLEIRNFGMYKNNKTEVFSFYYIPSENTKLYLITITEQLHLLQETEPNISIIIKHDRKNYQE